jgi:ACS family glucarate transporter-like MFS transporter
VTFVRHRILALLVLLSFVNYILRNNLSVAMPAIRADFSFTNEQIGWILAAFNVAYTLMQVPGGVFSDRLGSRRALAVLAVLWSLITAATGFVPDLMLATAGGAFLGLVVVRVLMGATHAPIFPASAGAIARWYPAGYWALPFALLGLGLNLGQASTGPLVSGLIEAGGWRGSFVLLAPLGLLAAWGWWSYARDTPQQHSRVDALELKFICGDATGVTSNSALTAPQESIGKSWRAALLDRQVLLLTASYFSMNVVFLMFSQWLFIYLIEERGFSLLEGGLYYALPFIAGAVFAPLGGYTCDRLCRRLGPTLGCRLPAIFGLTLAAVLLLVGAQVPNAVLAVAVLALCYAFTQFTDSVFWSATTYASGPHTAVAGGVLNTGGNVAGFLAPVIGALIDRAGWGAAFVLGAVFAALGALLWLAVRLQTPATVKIAAS